MTLSVPRLIAALLVAAPAAAQDAAPSPLAPPEIASRLRSHVAALATEGRFSGAVLLARGDELLVREAHGEASRETKTRNTPETRFNLGSIDKAFTRLAVERLAAAGKLSLSDTLDRYVPEYPAEKAKKITLRHLLEHRAGTGPIFGPRYDAWDKSTLRTLRDWLPLFADEPLFFEPGTGQRYSNAGYVLLGLVIEKVTGRSYHDHVRETIFIPAGMTSTGSLGMDERGADVAVGYTRQGGTLVDNRAGRPWRGSSAGGGYSTVDDLFRFARALRNGTFGVREDGLGVAGGAPGINAVLEMAGDYTLVVLANLDPPAAEAVAERAREWLPAEPEGRGRRRVRVGGGAGGPTVEVGGPPRRPGRTEIPESGVDVPMARALHLPAVEVKIHGQGPFLFAIDTGGAGLARVDPALVERLGLRRVGEVLAGDPSGVNARALPVVALDSIEVGGARFTGLTAAVRDFGEGGRDGRVDGVLGFGLFADALLTLDYPGSRVRLARGELAEGPDVVAYRDPNGVPAIPIRVAGRALTADLDTGAPGGLILPESEAAGLPLSGALEVVGRARTVSNTFEIKAAELAGDATIGPITLRRPRLEFQPVMPVVTIGARVLEDLVVSFDQKNARVRLARGQGAKNSSASR